MITAMNIAKQLTLTDLISINGFIAEDFFQNIFTAF